MRMPADSQNAYNCKNQHHPLTSYKEAHILRVHARLRSANKRMPEYGTPKNFRTADAGPKWRVEIRTSKRQCAACQPHRIASYNKTHTNPVSRSQCSARCFVHIQACIAARTFPTHLQAFGGIQQVVLPLNILTTMSQRRNAQHHCCASLKYVGKWPLRLPPPLKQDPPKI